MWVQSCEKHLFPSAAVEMQESWGREPVHTLTLALWAAESRLDYMGSSVLMGRVSKLDVELRDEWRLCEGCEATKRPALLFVHGQVSFVPGLAILLGEFCSL